MLMLQNTPHNAYRRVAVDARIKGAQPADLALICYEQVVSELGRAIRGAVDGDPARRADGLTRANAALTALEMGLDRTNPVAGALEQLFAAARETILQSVANFDVARLQEVRDDFAEIRAAMAGAVN